MSWLSDLLPTPAPAAAAQPDQVSVPAAEIPGLAQAFAAVAPSVDAAVWLPSLTEFLTAAEITVPHRVAIFLGQTAVETGGYRTLSENDNYTSAARLVQIFPSHFPTIESTDGYVGNPQRIAARAMAGKLGNGDEASGDGWIFRGAGCLQLTGRDNITAWATSIGMTPEDAADYARTPAGAVASACWFWATNDLNPLADAWAVSAVTRKINGPAMEANGQRIALSVKALSAMGAA